MAKLGAEKAPSPSCGSDARLLSWERLIAASFQLAVGATEVAIRRVQMARSRLPSLLQPGKELAAMSRSYKGTRDAALGVARAEHPYLVSCVLPLTRLAQSSLPCFLRVAANAARAENAPSTRRTALA